MKLALEPIRTTNERIQDDEILRDVIYVTNGLNCTVCDLTLANTAEIRAAGLPQQHTNTVTESFQDRFMSSYEPDDYGND